MVFVNKNLYQDTTLSYATGARDTGTGVGMPRVTPLFDTWLQIDSPPNGIYRAGSWGYVGSFVSGDYLYLLVNTTVGTGKGIYRYELDLDTDPISMSYDSMVAIGDLGFHASIDSFNIYRTFVYDRGSDSVVIFAHKASNGTYTPCLRKWDLSSWPFTDSNEEWSSDVIQRFGTYDAGDISRYALDMVLDTDNNNLFIPSAYSGTVHTINFSDGVTAGIWNTYEAYAGTYPMCLLGVDPSDGQPIGGGYRADQGNDTIVKWDISNKSAWSAGDVVFDKWTAAGGAATCPPYKGTLGYLMGTQATVTCLTEVILDDIFGADCGLVGCVFPQKGPLLTSPPQIRIFSSDLSTYYEVPLSYHGSLRGVSNLSVPYGRLGYLSMSDGTRFLLSNRMYTLEHEDEQPASPVTYRQGISAMQVNDAVVTYTFTATTPGLPYRIDLVIGSPGSSERDVASSAHHSKHAFRMRTNSGPWTAWRAGPRQLSYLDDAVDGSAAWSSWAANDIVEIEHKMNTGFMKSFYNVYSHDGTEAAGFEDSYLITGDKGPPREVVAALYYDDYITAGGSVNKNLSSRLTI